MSFLLKIDDWYFFFSIKSVIQKYKIRHLQQEQKCKTSSSFNLTIHDS